MSPGSVAARRVFAPGKNRSGEDARDEPGEARAAGGT